MTYVERTANWAGLYIIKPVLQILLFVVGSAVFMSLIAIAVGVLFQTPASRGDTRDIDLLQVVFIQLPGTLIDGLTIGFLYAVIALGYTMVYGVLRFINFAHSEIFMVGSVVGYEVMIRLREADQLRNWSPVTLVILMIFTAMIICGLLAVVIERFAYRPLRNA